MNKIQVQLMKQAHIKLKSQQNLIKKLSKWKIFPIIINNGAIALTETGYKPINSKITDFGQYELILSGNTPIVLQWKNSTKIYQKNKGTLDPTTNKTSNQDQFYTKQYQIGAYWNAFLTDDNSGVDFGSLTGNDLFKTIGTTRQYTLVMFEEHITIDDYLQFFVVFNDENENIGGTGQNQDRQVLYISNVTNYYSPYNGDFSMQVLTFSSVNDRVSASGQTTLGFMNWASPGSGYAFPSIKNGIVALNRTLMRDIGVRYAHRQSYGLELLSSCYYFGRPIIQGQKPIQIDNKEKFEQKVFASRRLFIAGNNDQSSTNVKNNGGLLAGINDSISVTSHPETTFYNIMDARPTGFTNYKDWQTFLASKQFNMLAEKDFKGILAFDKNKATKSNGTAIGNAKFFWDSQWNINNLTGIYNVNMSSNFKYKDPNTNIIIGSPTVNYANISQKNMSAILNFNSVVFSSLIQMPYDANQWLPFALSSIPLIGELLNSLMLGIPTGFVISQNAQQYSKMPYFNGFMSAFFADNLDKIIGNGGLIPLNVFSNNSNLALGKLIGANVSTTAMTMKLTDRISVYPWDSKTGNKLSNKEQISTVDLSQKRNNKIYIMTEETQFLDIKSLLTNEDTEMQWNPTPNGVADGQEYAYIIDTIVTQSLHQGEERHTFYADNPFTYQGDYNEISVAQFRYHNMGALTGNTFNWTTVYKLNHDEYNASEKTTFSYPANILPPDPLDIAKTITINPNLNINMTANNLHLTISEYSQTINNTNNWYNENKSKIASYELNFNQLLNPKLQIKNMNDLKKYYKSITIYYNYKINTQTSTKNSQISYVGWTDFSTSEEFLPSDTYRGIVEWKLNDLKTSNQPPNNNHYKHRWYKNKDIHTRYINTTGLAYAHGDFTNKQEMYSLNHYEFAITAEANTGNWNLDFDSDSILLNFVNNGNLHLTIYLITAMGKIENRIIASFNQDGHAYKYISHINANITNITINPK